jgi:hypothetical protein
MMFLFIKFTLTLLNFVLTLQAEDWNVVIDWQLGLNDKDILLFSDEKYNFNFPEKTLSTTKYGMLLTDLRFGLLRWLYQGDIDIHHTSSLQIKNLHVNDFNPEKEFKGLDHQHVAFGNFILTGKEGANTGKLLAPWNYKQSTQNWVFSAPFCQDKSFKASQTFLVEYTNEEKNIERQIIVCVFCKNEIHIQRLNEETSALEQQKTINVNNPIDVVLKGYQEEEILHLHWINEERNVNVVFYNSRREEFVLRVIDTLENKDPILSHDISIILDDDGSDEYTEIELLISQDNQISTCRYLTTYAQTDMICDFWTHNRKATVVKYVVWQAISIELFYPVHISMVVVSDESQATWELYSKDRQLKFKKELGEVSPESIHLNFNVITQGTALVKTGFPMLILPLKNTIWTRILYNKDFEELLIPKDLFSNNADLSKTQIGKLFWIETSRNLVQLHFVNKVGGIVALTTPGFMLPTSSLSETLGVQNYFIRNDHDENWNYYPAYSQVGPTCYAAALQGILKHYRNLNVELCIIVSQVLFQNMFHCCGVKKDECEHGATKDQIISYLLTKQMRAMAFSKKTLFPWLEVKAALDLNIPIIIITELRDKNDQPIGTGHAMTIIGYVPTIASNGVERLWIWIWDSATKEYHKIEYSSLFKLLEGDFGENGQYMVISLLMAVIDFTLYPDLDNMFDLMKFR